MALAVSKQLEGNVTDDGHRSDRHRRDLFRALLRLRQGMRQPLVGSDPDMLVEYILGGGVTLFLLAYLTYALVRPERF